MDEEDFNLEKWFLVVRKTGKKFGVVYHTGDKRSSGARVGHTLGSEIRTPRKTTRLCSKNRAVLGESFWIIAEPFPLLKDIEMLGGSWIYFIQTRRQVMGAIQHLWSIINGDCSFESMWLLLADDLLRLISLLPLVCQAAGARRSMVWPLAVMPLDQVVVYAPVMASQSKERFGLRRQSGFEPESQQMAWCSLMPLLESLQRVARFSC